MYLGTLYVTLDLEPEVTSADRERVLRSLRDKIRQAQGHRVTVRTDEEASIMVAFFDQNYSRINARIQEMIEKLESFSEARIYSSSSQVFCWYDGRFQETGGESDNLDEEEPASRRSSRRMETIPYHEDEDEGRGFSPLPSRFSRRTVRTPSRR